MTQRPAEVTLASEHGVYGAQDLLRCLILGEIAAGSSTQDVDRILSLRETAQHQHACVRVRGADLAEDVDTAAIRHVDVQYQQIKGSSAQLRQRLCCGSAFGNGCDRSVLLEKMTQPR